MEYVMSDSIEILSFENCKRNKPAFRHYAQDDNRFEVHNFLNRVDIAGYIPPASNLFDSHPTGVVRKKVDRDCLLDTEETVLREHGVSAFV
jgi:hypothetical protein